MGAKLGNKISQCWRGDWSQAKKIFFIERCFSRPLMGDPITDIFAHCFSFVSTNGKRRSIMKYKHMVIWGVLLLIISCAGVEPTRVENGLYINPAYHFSLSVPAGWETSDELPNMLKKGMSFVSRQNFKATFSDLKNKCFILVSAEKTEADWVSFKMYSDKFITSLDEFFAKEKKKFLKKPGSNYYRYEIYQDHIENCDSDCIATKIDFHATDLKATGYNILYKSDHGMLYTVALILIAREERYATGLSVFKTVVDSFQRR
jgi:hypothetical protein